MNPISKELRSEIYEKVLDALGQTNIAIELKATTKYRAKVEKIAKLYNEYQAETEKLSQELKDQGLELSNATKDDWAIQTERPDRQLANDITNKVIVRLQYSKEPDFLDSIPQLIQEFAPKKEAEITR